jgi:hypothetical protein
MADFCHPYCPLIRRGFARDQLIFEVNFDHFAHQAVCRAAHCGDLLQDGQAWLARLQRALKRIDWSRAASP